SSRGVPRRRTARARSRRPDSSAPTRPSRAPRACAPASNRLPPADRAPPWSRPLRMLKIPDVERVAAMVAGVAKRMIEPQKAVLFVERLGLRHVRQRLEIHAGIAGPPGALDAPHEDFLPEAETAEAGKEVRLAELADGVVATDELGKTAPAN